jgi:hypothetical protein
VVFGIGSTSQTSESTQTTQPFELLLLARSTRIQKIVSEAQELFAKALEVR